MLRALSLIKGPVEEPGFTWGRVLQWYPPCGDGVRPYMLWGKPHIGRLFQVIYQIYSLPREDGIYATPGAWAIVSIAPPRNYEEPTYVFPNGCVLLWDLTAPTTLVWSFGGVTGYKDALMEREFNGRTAILRVAIPDDRSFVGQRLWTQMLTFDPPQVKTSQLIEVKIGDPVSGPR
jgi:hypothetical protein